MKVFFKAYFKKTIVFPLLLLMLTNSCSSEEEEIRDEKRTYVYSSFELEILHLVNVHRITTGQKGLKKLDEISNQALLHTEHMLREKEVCHHNFGGRYRALAEKAGAKSMGENVGYGYRTPEAFVKAWLNSAPHRKIIEGESTHFGISAKQAEEKKYATLIFIRN